MEWDKLFQKWQEKEISDYDMIREQRKIIDSIIKYCSDKCSDCEWPKSSCEYCVIKEILKKAEAK